MNGRDKKLAGRKKRVVPPRQPGVNAGPITAKAETPVNGREISPWGATDTIRERRHNTAENVEHQDMGGVHLHGVEIPTPTIRTSSWHWRTGIRSDLRVPEWNAMVRTNAAPFQREVAGAILGTAVAADVSKQTSERPRYALLGRGLRLPEMRPSFYLFCIGAKVLVTKNFTSR